MSYADALRDLWCELVDTAYALVEDGDIASARRVFYEASKVHRSLYIALEV
jgi:hypothetical protein